MIIYFSATGNSQYVAERIAQATGDNTVSITACMKDQQFQFEFYEGEFLGIVSPTYSWGLPEIVKEFLQKMNLNRKPSYIWFIATYGTTTGQIGNFANEILQKQNVEISAYFSVKMPDTWMPVFNLSKKEYVRKIKERAELQIDSVIDKIANHAMGDYMQRKVPMPIAKWFYNHEYDIMRKTSHFHVEETCVGCGLCARNCLISAIDMVKQKPSWNTARCVMCLSCLHHCPKFAIQYGNKTKKHGQYVHAPVQKAPECGGKDRK